MHDFVQITWKVKFMVAVSFAILELQNEGHCSVVTLGV
jgi:hypothetical protein